MRRVELAVDVGSDGTGIASIDLTGAVIMNVYRKYTGQTGTPTGVLFEQYPGAERTLLTVASSAANGNSPVMVNQVDSANSAQSGAYGYPVVCGEVKLRVTGGTQKAAGVVWYLTVLDSPPIPNRG